VLFFLLEWALLFSELYLFAEVYDQPFAVYLLPLVGGAAILIGRNGTVPVGRAALPVAAVCGGGFLLALVLAASKVEPLRIAPFQADGWLPLLLRSVGQSDWLVFLVLLGTVSKTRLQQGDSDEGPVWETAGNAKRIRRCILCITLSAAAGTFVVLLFSYGTLGAMCADLYYPFRMVLRGVGLDAFGVLLAGFLRLFLYTAVIRQAASHLPPKHNTTVWYMSMAVILPVGLWLAHDGAAAQALRMWLRSGIPVLVLLVALPALLLFFRKRQRDHTTIAKEDDA